LIEKIGKQNDTIKMLDEIISPAVYPESGDTDYGDRDYYNYYYQDLIGKALLKKEEISDKRDYYIKLIEFVEGIDFDNVYLDLKVVNIGVAYDDTYVTKIGDLQPCIGVRVAEDENVDLALIQTKTKIFNKPPKKIFNFSDNNPNIFENPKEHKERNIKKPVKVNDDVFMIGYNRGFILANTTEGIKSQFTSGKISQESDKERILYTIPTLEGSSGSPIIDKWGNLVGVNFAKLNDSHGFSFGVPVYKVKEFYEEE